MCTQFESLYGAPLGFLYKNVNNFIYICSQCNEEFNNGSELEQHTLSHDVDEHKFNPNEIEFEVTALPFLGFEFAESANIKEEQNDDPSEPSESSIDDPDEPSDGTFTSIIELGDFEIPKSEIPDTQRFELEMNFDSYTCDICKREFTTYVGIKRHLHGGHKTTKFPPRKKKFVCNVCGRQTVNMEKHMREMHKCPFCEQIFKEFKALAMHRRNLHRGEKKFKCDRNECTAAFHDIHLLNAHINTKHLHLRTFLCDVCGMIFILLPKNKKKTK